MRNGVLLRVGLVVAATFALFCVPQVTLAQRGGGHGGGGGFHGGGGGFHGGGGSFHGGGGFTGGGRSFGGFRGGSSFGGRGFGGRGFGGRGFGGRGFGGRGFGRGFGGRGFGRRGFGYGYGYGFGFDFGFGWPYWGYGWGYPYGYYGYYPGYYEPYPYYYSYLYPPDGYYDDSIGDYPPNPSDYDDGRNYNNRRPPNYGPGSSQRPPSNGGSSDRPQVNPNGQPQPDQNRPPAPPGAAGDGNVGYDRGTGENFAQRPRVISVDPLIATQASYRAAQPSLSRTATTAGAANKPDAPLRPEMRRAVERLRNMPPFAREREIETGRYSQFSPEDKQILRNAE